MSYDRPTKDAKPKEDFWAFLDRPVPENKGAGIGKHRVEVIRSPIFATQTDLFAWIKSSQREGDELSAWKRVLSDGGFYDVNLVDDDDVPANPTKLAQLLDELRTTLDAQRMLARPIGRQHVNARALGIEARQRLERAGQAVKDSEPV